MFGYKYSIMFILWKSLNIELETMNVGKAIKDVSVI